MKQILMLVILCALTAARAQDAAVEERLNKLDGYVKDLLAAQADTQKRIASLAKELEDLRDQNKAGGTAATQDDLKRLADTLQEVDRKRLEDYEKIHKEIKDLGKALASPVPSGRGASGSREREVKTGDSGSAGSALPDKGFEYVVQQGDTLSVIVQAYREKGVKITVDQIVKANPGLNPNLLKIGQKVFIPAPEK